MLEYYPRLKALPVPSGMATSSEIPWTRIYLYQVQIFWGVLTVPVKEADQLYGLDSRRAIEARVLHRRVSNCRICIHDPEVYFENRGSKITSARS